MAGSCIIQCQAGTEPAFDLTLNGKRNHQDQYDLLLVRRNRR